MTAEEVASRLRAFVEAVHHKATTRTSSGGRTAPRSQTPHQEVFEECADRLSAEERTQLVLMIEKMSADLRDKRVPPGLRP